MLISTVIVWNRGRIQRTLINHRFTYLIKRFLTQNKEKRKPEERQRNYLLVKLTERRHQKWKAVLVLFLTAELSVIPLFQGWQNRFLG